jgi:hypothetical protein
MECFIHAGASAVGICRNCSRGVCHACAVDNGFGVACKNRCETEVEEIAGLITKNVQITQKGGGAVRIQFYVFLLVGLIGSGVAAYGLMTGDWSLAIPGFIVGPMLLALAYGQYQWLSAKVKTDTTGIEIK